MSTLSVSQAIEAVYEAFATQRPPSEIEACPHCHEPRALCALLTKPLRTLTADELGAYAASVLLTTGSEVDFKYLLPRILEISLEEADWWPSREVVLEKLELAHWQQWPQHQLDSLRALFDAVFARAVAACLEEEIDSLLCGFSLAGLDIDPYLKRLEAPAAAPVVVRLFERNAAQIHKGKLANSFWSGKRERGMKFLQWLQSPVVQAAVNAHYGIGGRDG